MNKLLWTYFENDSLIFFSLAIVGMISNILYCTRGKYKGQIAYRYVFVLLVWLLILDVCDRAGVVIPEGVYQAGNFFSCVFLGIMIVIALEDGIVGLFNAIGSFVCGYILYRFCFFILINGGIFYFIVLPIIIVCVLAIFKGLGNIDPVDLVSSTNDDFERGYTKVHNSGYYNLTKTGKDLQGNATYTDYEGNDFYRDHNGTIRKR